MQKTLLSFLLIFFMLPTFAAFVPLQSGNKAETEPATIENMIRNLSPEEFQVVTGKKLNEVQKWQYKRLQRKLNSNKSFHLPERDELTEGFQALPFFGSLFTLGLVYLVMLFTAQDKNALRWAGYGFSVAALVLSAMVLITSLSGY